MDYIEKKAYAKINIALDVIGKREDGYHDMKMIMQTIDIYDNIKISKNSSKVIKIDSNREITEDIENNLVYKATKEVLVYNGIFDKVGLSIYIEKNIPMEAGMAGGSADCATTIIALNELFNFNMTMSEMMEIGKKLGSDVPYCLVGGTKLVEGIGDIISDLADMPEIFVLVVKPKQSVSTKDIFGKLDLDLIKQRPNFEKIINAINSKDSERIASNFCNIFEEVTIPIYPEIQKIKDEINNYGALNSLMTGTGSTVFGFFDNINKAKSAKVHIKTMGVEMAMITSIIC